MLPGRPNVFGTATLDAVGSEAGDLGQFSPSTISPGVVRKEEAILLLPALNVSLQVQVWPHESGACPGSLRFEPKSWKYGGGGRA